MKHTPKPSEGNERAPKSCKARVKSRKTLTGRRDKKKTRKICSNMTTYLAMYAFALQSQKRRGRNPKCSGISDTKSSDAFQRPRFHRQEYSDSKSIEVSKMSSLKYNLSTKNSVHLNGSAQHRCAPGANKMSCPNRPSSVTLGGTAFICSPCDMEMPEVFEDYLMQSRK